MKRHAEDITTPDRPILQTIPNAPFKQPRLRSVGRIRPQRLDFEDMVVNHQDLLVRCIEKVSESMVIQTQEIIRTRRLMEQLMGQDRRLHDLELENERLRTIIAQAENILFERLDEIEERLNH